MATLHLGVIDIPYADTSYTKKPKNMRRGRARRGKVEAPAPSATSKSTGMVAEILEAKYHIMETFANRHEDLIVSSLNDAIEDALETMMLRGNRSPGSLVPTAAGEQIIEDRFKQFLSQREMDGLAGGVPTAAALRGVSHRFLHPYARRASRPSFIDTGLYQANFKVWVD
jgi:hypothetical protein